MLRFLLSIILIFCLSLFAFERYSGRLFTGLDGPSFVAKTEIQQKFFSKSLKLNSDIMEGLSSEINDFNLRIKPPIYAEPGSKFYISLFYTWYALQLFLSILIIGWNYQFRPKIYYLAAFFLTITLLPYFQNFRVYSLSEAAPCFLEFIFVFALMDLGIQRMGRIGWIQSLFYAAVLLLGLIYGLIFCPSAFIIIAPVLFITTIHSFLSASTYGERLRKIILCVALLILSFSLGWLQYAAGLILDSAASFFHDNINGYYHSKIYASILYIGNLPGSQIGPYLFCFASMGLLLAIFRTKNLRKLAFLILIAQVILAGGGAVVMSRSKPWVGPSLIYFEMILFPFYALFAIYFIDALFSLIFFKLKPHYLEMVKSNIYYIVASIFIVSLLVQTPVAVRANSYSLPPESTSLTRILEDEISIRPNDPFAGRVANILPGKEWLEQCAYFSGIDRATGNDHQASGLWFKQIPTLHSYHQEISPGFFSFYRRYLTSADESLYRNWTSFSKIDTKILRLLGVKFVLTTTKNVPGMLLRDKLNINDGRIEALYLYQLPNVNISGISAQEIIEAPSIFSTENLIGAKNFDLHTAVLISGSKLINERLSPAINSTLRVNRDGFHLIARSKGKTLLILPLEFNHCIKVTLVDGQNPQLIRVDGILLGVLFEKNVNSILQYQTGPFSNARCKLNNYLEFKRLWRGDT